MTRRARIPGLDDFRLVKAVADARGMAGAAAGLGVNPSTVFRRLGQIEEALGTPLFQRHRSGYDPTSAGAEMVALAQRLESDIVSFTRRIARQAIAPAGELRVVTDDPLLTLLTPIFARFFQQCQDVRLDVVLVNEALNPSKHDADVAICAIGQPPDDLVGRRVGRIAWALHGRGADWEETDANGPESCAESPWVSLGDGFGALDAVRFVRENVAPERVVYRANTVLGLAEAVEAGIGIGYLPSFVGDVRPGLVRLSGPQPDLAADLWLLTYPDLRQSARVRVFLDFLAAEIGRHRPLIEGDGVCPALQGELALMQGTHPAII